MHPLVTCLLVNYNYGRYLQRAIDSVLMQRGLTADQLEVIVVDDGSTDGSNEVLSGYGNRITVMHQANAGPAVATNRGIAAAHGEFIGLLDADDEWLPDKLVRQLELLAERPEVALVHGDMAIIDSDDHLTHLSRFASARFSPVSGRALGKLLQYNHTTTSAMLVRTAAVTSLPSAPDWVGCRDWWIAAHIASCHEVDLLHAPVALYRRHDANLSDLDLGTAKALRLQARDARVAQLLLRTLDLRLATLDELDGAWRYELGRIQRVTKASGQPVATAFPVATEERDASSRLLEDALSQLASDPVAAGTLAVRAFAWNPFEPRARALFERALSAVHGLVSPPAPVSVAHGARMRALADACDRVQLPELDPASRVQALRAYEQLRRSVAAGLPIGESLPQPTEAAREQAFEQLAVAVRAAARSDLSQALDAAAIAQALDPADAHAGALLDELLLARRGERAEPRPQDLEAARRLHPQVSRALPDSRPLLVAADASELEAEPRLLDAFMDAFAPSDPVTLAIITREQSLERGQQQVLHALAEAGVEPESDYDFALLPQPSSPAELSALARQVSAVLGTGRLGAVFAGNKRFGAADADRLRQLAERRWNYDGLGRSHRFAIKICPQHWSGAERWGDTHFARALAEELQRRGHSARIDVVDEWDAHERERENRAEVVIHLRGSYAYAPQPDQINVLWNISHPEQVSDAEYAAYDLIATPSSRIAERLRGAGLERVIVLEQATDPVVFYPERDLAYVHELVLVGNSRGIHRRIIRDLLPTAHDLAIWGQQWEPFVDGRYIAGQHLPNDEVRRAYSSAAIVLNDHWDSMREQGIISNRIFDALAAGAMVLSDDLPGIHERFGDAVATYRDRDDLQLTVERLLADPAERAERAARGREIVLRSHTFNDRVDTLLDALAALPAGSSNPAINEPITRS